MNRAAALARMQNTSDLISDLKNDRVTQRLKLGRAVSRVIP